MDACAPSVRFRLRLGWSLCFSRIQFIMKQSPPNKKRLRVGELIGCTGNYLYGGVKVGSHLCELFRIPLVSSSLSLPSSLNASSSRYSFPPAVLDIINSYFETALRTGGCERRELTRIFQNEKQNLEIPIFNLRGLGRHLTNGPREPTRLQQIMLMMGPAECQRVSEATTLRSYYYHAFNSITLCKANQNRG